MKGLNKVNRTAASSAESLLDPLSAFAQQSTNTDNGKDDGFTVVERTASTIAAGSPLDAPEVLASPNPAHLSRNKSNNGSSDRPNSLTSLSNSFNNMIRQASSFPKTSISPMRSSEPPAVSPVRKEPSPTRNQRGSVVQADDYDETIPLLSGESRIMALIDASTHVISLGMITGTLFMTNYRIVFIPSRKETKIMNPSIASWLNIPLGSIDKLEKEKRTKDILSASTSNAGGSGASNSQAGIQIVIYCKDCRQIRINVKGKTNSANGDYELERAFNLMSAYAFPNDVRLFFAYSHNYSKRRIIDLKGEYDRLGVTTKYTHVWKMTDANSMFKLCSSYPESLIIPQEIREEELSQVASFRSGQRIPTLTWCNRNTGATLWRSSQPKAGVSGTCSQDERLIDAIAKSNTYNKHVYDSQPGSNSEPFLFIVDCRSRTSAMANRAAGAGYESQTAYPNTRLEFYNIPNIHAVRDSYKSLVSIILNPSATPSSDINFTKQIEDTQWLTNIRLILKASWDTATTILRGCPVLVHCSHGWDRTAQVCALAQLMLDPYYRTIKGFIVLLEKDWLSFGHPFKMRCGHGNDKATRQEEEVSQIFLQFLDCVWQFIKQYSYHFEFNSQFILTIADHIYSCRFGNFIFSCEQQRKSNECRKSAADLWAYLESNHKNFVNPHYVEGNVTSNTFFVPPLGQLLRGVSLWSDFFLRWSSVSSVPKLTEELQTYLTPNGIVPQSDSTDDELLPMVSSLDYWQSLIAKERKIKQLYANELMKIKASNEALLKRILETSASAEGLATLKEEIEQQITLLNQETTDLLLLEQVKEEEIPKDAVTNDEQQNAAIALVLSNNGEIDQNNNNSELDQTNSADRNSSEEVDISTQDMREAESEVSEEVYAIYV